MAACAHTHSGAPCSGDPAPQRWACCPLLSCPPPAQPAASAVRASQGQTYSLTTLEPNPGGQRTSLGYRTPPCPPVPRPMVSAPATCQPRCPVGHPRLLPTRTHSLHPAREGTTAWAQGSPTPHLLPAWPWAGHPPLRASAPHLCVRTVSVSPCGKCKQGPGPSDVRERSGHCTREGPWDSVPGWSGTPALSWPWDHPGWPCAGRLGMGTFPRLRW